MAALFAAACGPGTRTATETLREFYDAVQEQDIERLYCLMAGASEAVELGATDAERREGFERWVRAYYEAYEAGRDEGWVDLDEQGLALAKLFSLGRGTFITHDRTRSAGPDALIVESRVRFGYAHVDLSPFSPGTTLYFCGAPVGRVHAVRVPSGSGEVSVDALETVTVEWTLVRAPASDACPGGWTVASGAPVEGSATTREITWDF